MTAAPPLGILSGSNRLIGAPMYASRDDLLNALTAAQPLGGVFHEAIANDVIDDLVYDGIALFTEVSTRPHMLFFGRKGCSARSASERASGVVAA
jgi:hypothetical protein